MKNRWISFQTWVAHRFLFPSISYCIHGVCVSDRLASVEVLGSNRWKTYDDLKGDQKFRKGINFQTKIID